MSNPLVFIHGAGDNTRAWRAQTTFFGSRAFAVDLPGHGKRPDTLPAQVSVADYALAMRKCIKEELHLEQPIIVGHSLGGLIALELGLAYGSELSGLVLIGSGARMRVLPALLEMAQNRPEQAQLSLKQMSTRQQNEPAEEPTQFDEQVRPAPGILYRDLLACNTFDVMEKLSMLHLPTLVLCGVEDRNAPLKYSTYLHAQIVGSSLALIPDAGHYVQREKPDETNRAIEEWLRRTWPLDAP